MKKNVMKICCVVLAIAVIAALLIAVRGCHREEPTVPPTTAPATEATQAVPTEAETQPPTVPETTQAPETLPTQETVPPTLPQEPKDSSPVMGILIGVLIVSGTLSLLLIGLLIYRRKRDEDYDD